MDEQASMEPCLFRHGKSIRARLAPKTGDASMEPCLFRHGKGTPSTSNAPPIQLQWSHVFSDMVSLYAVDRALMLSLASMEPCLFRHGKKGTLSNGYRVIGTLQWSHVFSDMVSQDLQSH